MEAWEKLNLVRKSVYLTEKKDHYDLLEELCNIAPNSEDIDFIRGVLQVKEDADVLNPKRKLLWLTSTVVDRFYPPLSIDLGGPIQWNGNVILESKSEKIMHKYCLRKELAADKSEVNFVQQCNDIENCSFVASLIVLRNNKADIPTTKQIGMHKYNINLHFNGSSERLVTIDTSSIPTDSMGKQLALTSRNFEDKIIELAYLQVTAGSYDTDGSNFAIDMFMLTGYTPEIVDVDKYPVQKLIKFFNSKLCLLAVGTGDRSLESRESFLRNHDYPIVGVNEEAGSLIVRDTLDFTKRIEISDKHLLEYFKQVYLIWKTPKLFSKKTTLHFYYNSGKCNKYPSIIHKPKFILRNDSKLPESVWLLLESDIKKDRNSDENIVAYLKQISENAFHNAIGSFQGACDIGLQLLKLSIPAYSDLRFFCHSSKNAHLTAYMLSNSNSVTFKRHTFMDEVTSISFVDNSTENSPFGSLNYHKNPTIILEVPSSTKMETYVDLQLLSESPHDLINLSVFKIDDHNFLRPLIRNTDYTHQRYDKLRLPLITSTKYKLLCSTYSPAKSHEFIVTAVLSNKIASPPKIFLQQASLEHGGQNYKLERRFQWPKSSNKISVPFKTKTNNICFIRVVPSIQSPFILYRCNVFDRESCQKIYGTEYFQKITPGGFVLERVELYGRENVSLLIETDGTVNSSSTEALPFLTVTIGSHHKVTFDV